MVARPRKVTGETGPRERVVLRQPAIRPPRGRPGADRAVSRVCAPQRVAQRRNAGLGAPVQEPRPAGGGRGWACGRAVRRVREATVRGVPKQEAL